MVRLGPGGCHDSDKGHLAAASSPGTIVHIYEVKQGNEPAYNFEVIIQGPNGMQVDAHIFDALHHELKLYRE